MWNSRWFDSSGWFLVWLTVVLVVTVVPQAALADDQRCDSGEFCIWEDPNYGGDFWGADQSDPNWP